MIWQLLSIFIDVLTPVFALVLIGYVAKLYLNLDARTLSRAAYYIFIPAFVFNVISQASFDWVIATRMTLYIFAVHIACALLGFGLAKLMGRSTEVAAAFVLIATFGNVGNFGLSIVEFHLGGDALDEATLYFLAIMIIAFTICVGVASWARSSGLGAVFSVFKTPALLALIPAALFTSTEVEVPLFLARMTSLLGNAMIPVMLVGIGVQLAGVEKFHFSLDVVAASSVRLIGAPILAILLVIPFGLIGIERSAGILQASMPTAILAWIIAMEYDLIPDFVTTCVLFSTVASLLTLAILLLFV